ncbi:MAG: (2Fe-2S)-binding protein [Planctomyces sp.]|nr:(2Fe-2S)-binding protein [Planctomyces sp.]
MPKVTFVKEKKTIEAPAGSNLRQVARRNGVNLYPGPHQVVNCMGFGMCGSCRVIVRKGTNHVSPPGAWERFTRFLNPVWFFARIGREQEMRLACQCTVEGDIEVETQPPLNQCDKFWA